MVYPRGRPRSASCPAVEIKTSILPTKRFKRLDTMRDIAAMEDLPRDCRPRAAPLMTEYVELSTPPPFLPAAAEHLAMSSGVPQLTPTAVPPVQLARPAVSTVSVTHNVQDLSSDSRPRAAPLKTEYVELSTPPPFLPAASKHIAVCSGMLPLKAKEAFPPVQLAHPEVSTVEVPYDFRQPSVRITFRGRPRPRFHFLTRCFR